MKQICMLAQGEFLKLLLAPDRERRDVFRRVFDTALYERVQAQLKRRAQETEARLGRIRQEIEASFAALSERDGEQAQRLNALRAVGTPEDAKDALGELERLLQDDAARIGEIEKEQRACEESQRLLDAACAAYRIDREKSAALDALRAKTPETAAQAAAARTKMESAQKAAEEAPALHGQAAALEQQLPLYRQAETHRLSLIHI